MVSALAAPPPAPFHLSDEDMARVSQLLYRLTGMTFGANKRYYIERRIAARMAKIALSDVRSYLARAASGVEAEQLINAFTVNETYFYREEHQLAALANTILPDIIRDKRPGDLIRLWSMPCSTGEEPYSIAIWLLENWPLVDAYNIEIVGSDIDTAAIAAATAGRFNARSLAKLPPGVLAAYFEPEHRHHRKIIDDLRESVRFTATNLVDPASVAAQGKFDVVLCRNLLIYFDDASRAAAAANMHDALNPGGFLCLGHSESMARISDRFTLARLDDAIVYRKA
jgi:chemotaxis protein methyltransferase CheR